MTAIVDQLRELDPASATALEILAAERLRQITVEGWSIEHDDRHQAGDLALAAAAYIEVAGHAGRHQKDDTRAYVKRACWPWDKSWWKPKTPMEDLTRGGALVVSEIARRLRIEEERRP